MPLGFSIYCYYNEPCCLFSNSFLKNTFRSQPVHCVTQFRCCLLLSVLLAWRVPPIVHRPYFGVMETLSELRPRCSYFSVNTLRQASAYFYTVLVWTRSRGITSWRRIVVFVAHADLIEPISATTVSLIQASSA